MSKTLVLFVVLLGLWTWKLLEPYPVPESVRGELTFETGAVLAKGFHTGGYAVLTVLAGTLPLPRRWRWGLIAGLALHAVATEILQAVLPFNRTGRVVDVLLDWAGIAVGLAGLRVWASRAA